MKTFSCGDCAVMNCNDPVKDYPDFCLTKALSEERIEASRRTYLENEENHRILCAADQGYGMTRIDDTIAYAREMGFQKLGIASCVGLHAETRLLTKILRSHGFEVYAVACKVGAIMKPDLGIPFKESTAGGSKTACNPILQAQLLEEAGTELNIVVGLCVGHDSLFYRHSHCLTTTLITKDKVLGHNPAAALYAFPYYKRLLKEQQ